MPYAFYYQMYAFRCGKIDCRVDVVQRLDKSLTNGRQLQYFSKRSMDALSNSRHYSVKHKKNWSSILLYYLIADWTWILPYLQRFELIECPHCPTCEKCLDDAEGYELIRKLQQPWTPESIVEAIL